MSDLSFFWHDYETFGTTPRIDRPSQFAGVRTDAELREIAPPVMLHCQPSPEVLPDPEACLLTGITPQVCTERGIPEAEFAAAIEAELGRPGTIGVGYNSIRFDDEVTRHLFWRNLIDPYGREWQNGCGRWDLLDVVRCTWALRPEGLQWPQHEDGRPSFKLEHLTAANGVVHEAAHDALSDVRATLALARLIRQHQPRLFDFALRLRRKEAVVEEIERAQAQAQPFLHVSGRYGTDRGCLALVWPLAPHPTNRNELIVWDLAADPTELADLNAQQIRERLFVRREDLPEGVERLPIKTIHLNKSPLVIGNLRILTPALAERWGIDTAAALQHAERAQRLVPRLAGLWPDVYTRTEALVAADVEEDLYGGFVGKSDRRTLDRLRTLAPAQLAERLPAFEDPRLDELAWRYRARRCLELLPEAEQRRWHDTVATRLREGGPGRLSLADFVDRIDTLAERLPDSDERGQAILEALHEYGAELGERYLG